jgi:hypothetical protein
MEMFDTIIQTTIKPDGKAQVRTLIDEGDPAAMEFAEACEAFVAAETKWAKLDARASARWALPNADPSNLCAYFDALEEKYQADKRLWVLFVGKDRSVRSNRMYLDFRRALLTEGRTRADV